MALISVDRGTQFSEILSGETKKSLIFSCCKLVLMTLIVLVASSRYVSGKGSPHFSLVAASSTPVSSGSCKIVAM